MFGFKKNRTDKAQHNAALEEAGAAIVSDVSKYTKQRLSQIEEKFKIAFAERLKSISDEPDHSPAEVAQIELRIFSDRLAEIPGKLLTEIRTALPDHFKAISANNFDVEIDDLIQTLIKNVTDALYQDAIKMTDDAAGAADINYRFRQLNTAIDTDCKNHLEWIRNFDSADWNLAERDDNYETCILQYAAAVDGTEKRAREIFESRQPEIDAFKIPDLELYLTTKRLKYMLQIRLYFEHRLKAMLIPNGPARASWLERGREFLNQDLGKTL